MAAKRNKLDALASEWKNSLAGASSLNASVISLLAVKCGPQACQSYECEAFPRAESS